MRHFTILLFFFFSFHLYPSIDTVKLNLYLQKGTTLSLVSTGKFLEGQTYILPQKTLTSDFAPYQYYYDALAGGTFKIEEGGLDSNITVNVLINVPPTVPWNLGTKKIWFLGICEVEGIGSGNFYFKNDKAAVFEFPRTTKFDQMISTLGFQPGSTLQFAYLQMNGQFSSIDISTINDIVRNKLIAKIRHFSEIAAGDGFLTSPVNDTISLNLYLQKGLQTTLISQTKLVEGQSYTLPATTLTGDFAPYQYYYNALAGGKFYVEEGGLDSNITINALLNVPANIPWTIGNKYVWFLGEIEVAGVGAGNFFFKNNKAAVFEFPKTPQFISMVTQLGFSPGTIWRFAYLKPNGTFTSVDISTINDLTNNKVIAKIRHFSEIAAGDQTLTPPTTDTIKLNLYLQKGIQTALISQTKIIEGQKYTLPASTLTGDFAPYQYYYNAIAGGKFYVENNGLDSNITINALLNVPASIPWNLAGKKIWFLGLCEVEGFGAGNFYFKDDKAAVFEFPRTAQFDQMITQLGFQPGTPWKFAYITNLGTFTEVDISTINKNDTVFAYLRHFSEIAAGDTNIATSIIKEEKSNIIPNDFSLSQNYPNPFNPTTYIEYSVPKTGNVSIKIYDMLGREVSTIYNGIKSAGSYKILFTAANLPSGVYIYELKFEGKSISKKMLILK